MDADVKSDSVYRSGKTAYSKDGKLSTDLIMHLPSSEPFSSQKRQYRDILSQTDPIERRAFVRTKTYQRGFGSHFACSRQQAPSLLVVVQVAESVKKGASKVRQNRRWLERLWSVARIETLLSFYSCNLRVQPTCLGVPGSTLIDSLLAFAYLVHAFSQGVESAEFARSLGSYNQEHRLEIST